MNYVEFISKQSIVPVGEAIELLSHILLSTHQMTPGDTFGKVRLAKSKYVKSQIISLWESDHVEGDIRYYSALEFPLPGTTIEQDIVIDGEPYLLNIPLSTINIKQLANEIAIQLESTGSVKGGRPRSIPMTKRVKEIMLTRQAITPDKPFHLNNDQAINAWQWVRKEMGLENDKEFVLHALRHTCASRLLNKGVDIVTIRDWLGHADISTTMIYAHLAPNKLAHAAAILDTYNE